MKERMKLRFRLPLLSLIRFRWGSESPGGQGEIIWCGFVSSSGVHHDNLFILFSENTAFFRYFDGDFLLQLQDSAVFNGIRVFVGKSGVKIRLVYICSADLFLAFNFSLFYL